MRRVGHRHLARTDAPQRRVEFKKGLLAMRMPISAEIEPLRQPSSMMTQRLVLATESRLVFVSSGLSAQIDDFRLDALLRKRVGASRS